MRQHRGEICASFVLCALLLPLLLSLEFLADDFYMGRVIADAAMESPGVGSAISAAFTRRWTPDFDVFRPLTILTLQADWALWGAQPGLHHLLNLLLWIACAWLAAACARTLMTAPCTQPQRAALVLAFGLSPAVVECLGWCVAREDLLCGGFALAALLLLLRHPQRCCWRAVLVAGAFLSKETAVTIPPLLLWTDLVLRRPDGDGRFAAPRTIVLRALPTFGVLSAALIVRQLLFGQVAGLYGGRAFSAWLADSAMPQQVVDGVTTSLGRLLAPVAESAASTPAGFAVNLLLLLSTGLALLWNLRTPEGRLRAFAFAPWLVGPLLLAAVPLRVVGADMEDSRLLLLPLCALLLLTMPGVSFGHHHVLRWLTCGALLLACAVAQHWNLQPYSDATVQIRQLRRDAHTAAAGTTRVVVVGAVPDGAAVGLIPELIRIRGSFLLSEGFWQFTRPPFDDGPHLLNWTKNRPLQLQQLFVQATAPTTQDQAPPALATLVPNSAGLRLALMTHGGGGAIPASLSTTSWSIAADAASRELRFATDAHGPLVAHLVAPGETAQAEAVTVPSAGGVIVPFGAWRISSGNANGTALSPEVLTALRAPELLVWLVATESGQRSRVFCLRVVH